MKSSTLNFIWVIGLLLLVIAGLVLQIPDGEVVQDYIAFSSSIASLVLAVVAIFYSFITNKSFDTTLSEIRLASNRMIDETARLNAASSSISDEIEETIRRLGQMPDELTRISGELTSKIDDLRDTSDVTSEIGQPQAAGTHPALVGASLGYVLAFLAIAFSGKKARDFQVSDLIDQEENATAYWYFNGVIDALKFSDACGLKIDGIKGTYVTRNLGTVDADQIIDGLRPKDGDSISGSGMDWLRASIFEYFEGQVNKGTSDEPKNQNPEPSVSPED